MNELAGQCLGGYQLEEEIGHGSMGVVYRGKQIALEREVAVKVLPQSLARDASYVARFIREAQIIARLNHPNIVQIYDAGQQNKLLYFVMEYVQGPTLASLLRLDGTIPAYLAVEYAAQIADALDAAYKECHVIHRDIKPENLMLDRRGKIKVMDFGLARAPGLQRITVARTLVGSIYYSSPEQVWGYTLDNRSDIYALGVVLYEMVCGHRPFSGRSMLEVTQAITEGPLRSPRFYNTEISPELEQVILTSLARERDQRYSEADQFARALRALKLISTPPATLVLTEQLQSSSTKLLAHAAQGRTVVHPPKRPQARRPDYFAIDLQKTQPLHDEPARPAAEPHADQDSSAGSMDGPTRPLEHLEDSTEPPDQYRRPDSSQRTTASLISLPKRTIRKSLWSQLQRLLRPPPR